MSALYLLLTGVLAHHPLLASAQAKGLPSPPPDTDANASETTVDPKLSGVSAGAVIPNVQPESNPVGDRIDKLAEPTPATPPTSIQTVPGVSSSTPAIAPTPPRTLEPFSPQTVAPQTIVTAPTLPQVALPTPRPASNAQQYAQRVAALYAGRTYTRLTSDQFRDQWVNASGQPTYEAWVNLLAHEARTMANGQGRNNLTVMVGDSISQWYPNEQLSTERFWLNQGISGDNTTGILRRLSLFSQTRPDTIYVMAGINDLRQGATDETVMTNLRAIMRTLRQQHPTAHIVIHSILPTRLPTIASDRIDRLNQSIAMIARQESVNFLDLRGYFSDEQGNLRQELTTDGLHLNPNGYAMWDWVMRSLSQA